MNPKLLFWIPALLRLAFLFVIAGLCWWIAGPIAGPGGGVLLLVLGQLYLQLSYLSQLSAWLDDSHSAKLPDGWGAWTDVFARLYRLRRDDERSQAELTEWLARFRQAMHLLPDGVAIMDDVLFLEWCNPAAERHLGLTLERDKGMRVTNLVRHPDFIDYIILGRYEQPLTLSLRDRKLIVPDHPVREPPPDPGDARRHRERAHRRDAARLHRQRLARIAHAADGDRRLPRNRLEHARPRPGQPPGAPEADDRAGPPHAAPDRGHADLVAARIGRLSAAARAGARSARWSRKCWRRRAPCRAASTK